MTYCSTTPGRDNAGPCGPAPCTGECVDRCDTCDSPECPHMESGTCTRCEGCGGYFDLESEGRQCESYGDTCEDCDSIHRLRCSGPCCEPFWDEDMQPGRCGR